MVGAAVSLVHSAASAVYLATSPVWRRERPPRVWSTFPVCSTRADRCFGRRGASIEHPGRSSHRTGLSASLLTGRMMNQTAAPRRSPREVVIAAAGLALPIGPAHNAPRMKHIVLLGDSVFDNRAYVGRGPDIDITRPALPTPSCGGLHRPRREP